MGKYNFREDIKIGEEGENIIRMDLESDGWTFVSDNKDNKFDIIMKNSEDVEASFEIKTDVLCRPDRDTSNLFIEFECRGKESGVVVSKADYFVTYLPHLKDAWYIKTNDLRELIKNNNFKVATQAGDYKSNTKGYLIPRYQFKKHFKVKLIKSKWVTY